MTDAAGCWNPCDTCPPCWYGCHCGSYVGCPTCGECQDCEFPQCNCESWCTAPNSCCHGVHCCASGAVCCTDGHCIPGGTTCCGPGFCDPAQCMDCVGGECKQCGGDKCKTCDPETHTCNPVVCNTVNCEICVDGQCKICDGDTTKCCDHPELAPSRCVNKCTNSAQCDYGTLPTDPHLSCASVDPGSGGVCDEGIGGETCGYIISYYKDKDAQCANCAPGCSSHIADVCVIIKTEHCKEKCDEYGICICQCLTDTVAELGLHWVCGP